jgi:hypothetical protein
MASRAARPRHEATAAHSRRTPGGRSSASARARRRAPAGPDRARSCRSQPALALLVGDQPGVECGVTAASCASVTVKRPGVAPPAGRRHRRAPGFTTAARLVAPAGRLSAPPPRRRRRRRARRTRSGRRRSPTSGGAAGRRRCRHRQRDWRAHKRVRTSPTTASATSVDAPFSSLKRIWIGWVNAWARGHLVDHRDLSRPARVRPAATRPAAESTGRIGLVEASCHRDRRAAEPDTSARSGSARTRSSIRLASATTRPRRRGRSGLDDQIALVELGSARRRRA